MSVFICVFALLVTVSFGLSPTRGQGNYSVVFSAQSYRLAPRQTLVANQAAYHLFLLDPSSDTKIRLTRGNGDDIDPIWSPNRSRILFLRAVSYSQRDVCLVDVRTRKVSLVYRSSSDADTSDVSDCSWSPDGRDIGFVKGGPGRDTQLVVLTLKTGMLRRFPEVTEYAWAPDSRRLFLRASTGACRVMNLSTARAVKFLLSLRDPEWLNDRTLLGTVGEYPWSFVVADDRGHELRYILVSADRLGALNDYDPGFDRLCWRRVPQERSAVVFEAAHGMSDGVHSSSYALDVNTGHIRPLGDFEFHGFSRDGSECLVSSDRWVGRYKDGGQRLGPLAVLSLSTMKTRPLTEFLTSVGGADWF